MGDFIFSKSLTPSESFTFERSSGRLNNSHAIFINAGARETKRTMALLITTSGNFFVAELINGVWRTERDLKGMFPKQNTTIDSGQQEK